jgi:hypothetical protein
MNSTSEYGDSDEVARWRDRSPDDAMDSPRVLDIYSQGIVTGLQGVIDIAPIHWTYTAEG